MIEYSRLLRRILVNGTERPDRTGVGTISVFGERLKINLVNGFPLSTLRKMHFKNVLEELLWMLRGETNVAPLQAKGVHIWDDWAVSSGDLGPIYGHQWRNLRVDQVAEVVRLLREDPYSRRMILEAWNVNDLPDMALSPCVKTIQFYCRKHYETMFLDVHVYQRSADAMIGVPHNIASMALLAHIMAKVSGMYVGYLTFSYGDLHIYNNHVVQAKEVLGRYPLDLPRLYIHGENKLPHEYTADDFELVGYEHHTALILPVAV